VLICTFLSSFFASSFASDSASDGKLCPTCIDFMSEALDELLNIIANVGVIGGCHDICDLLSNSIEADICQVLCDVVGIEGFIKLINVTDPDPIYICEELDRICPVNSTGNATVISASVSPASGKQGTTFTITTEFAVTSQLGTGTLEFDVYPPDGEDFGDASLLIETLPGTYGATLSFKATPSEAESFEPGVYPVTVYVCESTCGSVHPNSKVYSSFTTQFTITQ